MNWSDDELDEREFPDDDVDMEDDGDDEETITRECPRCGADIYEDAEQCPLCGTWINPDTSAWSGRAWWFVLLGIAGIIALLWVLVLP